MPIITTNTPPESQPLPDTVVIVGASGFIGHNLVRHLKGRVRRIVPVSASGSPVDGIAGRRLAALDDADVGPDSVVVNLAAHRYDGSGFANAQPDIFLHNVDIVRRVYDYCRRHGISEVRSASSIAVYPSDDTEVDDGKPVALDRDPNDGELMYAWSKRIGEITGRLFARECGIHTVTFRLTNPFGPYDSIEEAKAHVVPAFILRALTTSGPFIVRGNSGASRDFMHVGDVCEIFCRSLSWRGRNDAYNLGSGENVTIGDLATRILRLVGGGRKIVSSGSSVSSVAHRRCPNGRVRAAFGIERFTPLDEGLRSTIDWYRDVCRGRS